MKPENTSKEKLSYNFLLGSNNKLTDQLKAYYGCH